MEIGLAYIVVMGATLLPCLFEKTPKKWRRICASVYFAMFVIACVVDPFYRLIMVPWMCVFLLWCLFAWSSLCFVF